VVFTQPVNGLFVPSWVSRVTVTNPEELEVTVEVVEVPLSEAYLKMWRWLLTPEPEVPCLDDGNTVEELSE
jgi:hypothetical protein